MQRILVLSFVFLATTVSARNLTFRRRIAYEASVKVVNFKCQVDDTPGNDVQHIARPANDHSDGAVRRRLRFQVTVRSTVLQPVAVRAVVRLFDKNGVKLLETKHDQYKPKIASEKTQVLQWEQWLGEELIKRVHSAEVYCGDHSSMLRRMSKNGSSHVQGQ